VAWIVNCFAELSGSAVPIEKNEEDVRYISLAFANFAFMEALDTSISEMECADM